jgi:hypothetical protein
MANLMGGEGKGCWLKSSESEGDCFVTPFLAMTSAGRALK